MQRNSGVEVFISGSGYLASIVTEDTSCGSTEIPWVLRASSGQQIRLRLYDFAVTNRERDQLADQLPRVCLVYAVIKENPSRGSETICGSEDRESHKYTSIANQLEVRMVAASTSASKKNQKKSYYMFQYEGMQTRRLFQHIIVYINEDRNITWTNTVTTMGEL